MCLLKLQNNNQSCTKCRCTNYCTCCQDTHRVYMIADTSLGCMRPCIKKREEEGRGWHAHGTVDWVSVCGGTYSGWDEWTRTCTHWRRHAQGTLSGECAETNLHSPVPVHVICRVLDCEGSKKWNPSSWGESDGRDSLLIKRQIVIVSTWKTQSKPLLFDTFKTAHRKEERWCHLELITGPLVVSVCCSSVAVFGPWGLGKSHPSDPSCCHSAHNPS